MTVNSATDIFQRFVFEPSLRSNQNDELFKELENIKSIATKNFDIISKDFSVKTPFITNNWDYASKN